MTFLRRALAIHGAIALLGAGLHGWWHWHGLGLPELAGLTASQHDLLALLNWAIAITLTLLGVASLWLAWPGEFERGQARGFAALFAGFWLGRLTLELAFPVKAPLLGPHTSGLILAVTSLLALLLAGATVMARPRRARSAWHANPA